MTLLRSALLALIGCFVLLAAQPASAAEWKDFDAGAFAAAQQDGKPILVDVFAAWCPVCRAQNPVLVQLTRNRSSKTWSCSRLTSIPRRTRFAR